MTEFTFLIELLLNHKLAKSTKEAISNRIKEVEATLGNTTTVTKVTPQPKMMHGAIQAASTIALLEADPNQPTIIAQTPLANQAMANRAEAIKIATSNIPEKGRTSPRKF